MIRQGVLRSGELELKPRLRSPYFSSLGNVSGGTELAELVGFFDDAIPASGLVFDAQFGPAYKGIPIAVAAAAIKATGTELAGLVAALDR